MQIFQVFSYAQTMNVPLLSVIDQDTKKYDWLNDFAGIVLSPYGLFTWGLGFRYDPIEKYWYTSETSVQSQGGFMDWYEGMGSKLGMDIDTLVITFETSEHEYRIQLWKGNYGLNMAYGAEIGIYYRPLSKAAEKPYEGNWGEEDTYDWYASVPEDAQWRTIQEIYAKDDPETELLINDTSTYAKNGDHFWNLAIKTDKGYTKDTLFVIDTFFIEDENIRDSFIAALSSFPVVIIDDPEDERRKKHGENVVIIKWE